MVERLCIIVMCLHGLKKLKLLQLSFYEEMFHVTLEEDRKDATNILTGMKNPIILFIVTGI